VATVSRSAVAGAQANPQQPDWRKEKAMEPIPVHPTISGVPAETAALAELHTRLLDTIAGFNKVIEKAEPDFLPIAKDFRAMHLRHARAIEEMLARDGHDPARDGSIFGAVNRGLVEVRSWFDTIGTNMMDPLVQGEKHVLDAYDDAIAKTAQSARKSALGAMRDAQIALMDRHCPPTSG